MGQHRASDRNGIEVSQLVERAATENVVSMGKHRARRDAEIDKSMSRHPAGKRRHRKGDNG